MRKKLLLASFLLLFFSIGKSQVKIIYTLDNHSRVNGEHYPDSLSIKKTFDSASNIATETTTNPCFSRPNPVITSSGSTTICFGDSVILFADSSLSYIWSNGETTKSIIVKQSGSFAVTTLGSLHCSKTSDTTIVKVNPLPIVTIIASDSTSFCSGKGITLSSSLKGKYLWNTGDTAMTIIADTSKNYVLQFTDSNGCKATASQQITVYPKPNAAFIPNALAQCDGNNFVFMNTSTLSSGDKTFVWNLGDGLADTSTNQNHIYTSSGNYTVTLLVTSDHNCRDSVTKNIIVYPNPAPVILGATIVCNNANAIYTTPIDSASVFAWIVNGGNIITEQGIDSVNINWGAGGNGSITVTDSSKATGCKTTTTPYIVTINSTTNSTTDTSICIGSTYSFNGNTYDSAGTYITHLTNTAGCDSVVTLHLSIKQPSTSRIDTSICKGSVYLFNGISYDSTGIYVQHLINSVGCDSATTLNLTINTPTSSTTDTSVCSNSLPYHWNGNDYGSTGIYTAHLTNMMGCDSIATLNLKVNANSISTTDTSICPSTLPYVWNSHSYDSTGFYTIHLINSNSCDSAATLHLIVNIATTSIDSIRICNSYLWNGITYTASGTYTFKTNNSRGCDSTATLYLVIDTATKHTDSISACNSYVWNNITYTTSGVYTFNASNNKGCDSTATLILVINTSTSSITNVSICPNDLPYSWNNNSYTTGGIYTVHLTNKAGCDSTAKLNLILNNTSASTTNISICPSGLPYHWNNNTYTIGGTYLVHLVNKNGCDSAATLRLTIKNSISSSDSINICSNQLPYSWNGLIFAIPGSQTAHLINAEGCDSAATLILTVSTLSTTSLTVATSANNVCEGTAITFTATPINGGANQTYQWKKNGITVGLNSNIFSSSLLANGDSVWCLLTSNNSCATNTLAVSNKIKMLVKALPNIASITNGIADISTISLCALGTTTRLFCTIPYGVWSSNNAAVASITGGSQAGLVTANINGISTIKYTVTNAAGCSSVASLLVNVAQQTTPNIITGVSSICAGKTTTLSNSTPSGVWSSLNDRGTINAATGIYTGNNAGLGQIKYTITNANGCSAYVSKNITVNAIPAVPSIGYASGTPNPQLGAPTGCFCLGKIFGVVGSPSGGNWNYTNPLVGTITNNGIVNLIGLGTGSIVYTYTDLNGCSNSRTSTGKVVACGLSKVFDNINSTTVSEFDFALYPNPAKDIISILPCSTFSSGRIFIYDDLGKEIIRSIPLSVGTNESDISKLRSGFYYIKILVDNNAFIRKFVKK